MKTRLSDAWSLIVGSFWFLPGVMALSSVMLAIGTLWVDSAFDIDWGAGRGLIYAGGVSGGREVLSTIAGSMMTVTGVVFSITIVTLSLTSNQYGPRLLRNFMSNRSNQIVLGTFISTFTYCLVVLRTLRDDDETVIVPEISISIGVLLALVSVGVLIFFIHHISSSIQASSILSGVGHELDAAIESLYPERIGKGERPSSDSWTTQPSATYGHPPHPLTIGKAGYIRAIDPQGMMAVASDHDLVIRLECGPGAFVFRDSRIGTVWSGSKLDDELVQRIRGNVILGNQRTAHQDVEYLMSQLVQPALLALSTGVNNSLVAITAIDWMGAALATLAGRQIPSDYRYDDGGNLRIISASLTFTLLFESAFNPLRESARSNTLVTLRLLDTIVSLTEHVTTEPQRQTLLRQTELLKQDSLESIPNEYDRSRILDRYRDIVRSLTDETLVLTHDTEPENVPE
ncbi:DUF2254 domain-containing protein [soil metagenome]